MTKDYGEGVYLGSANSNWKCHDNSGSVGNGCGNVWRGEQVRPQQRRRVRGVRVVHASNTATKAKKGVSNIPVTP